MQFLRRTFCSISSRRFCPARIYPFAGHLKFSPDMSGETGGFNILWQWAKKKVSILRDVNKGSVELDGAKKNTVPLSSGKNIFSHFAHCMSNNLQSYKAQGNSPYIIQCRFYKVSKTILYLALFVFYKYMYIILKLHYNQFLYKVLWLSLVNFKATVPFFAFSFIKLIEICYMSYMFLV